MVASLRSGWSLSLRRVRAMTSGLLAASPLAKCCGIAQRCWRVQELAECAGNGQQLVVREVLQGGEQLGDWPRYRRGKIWTACGWFQRGRGCSPQCVFDGISKHFAEHTDITTQRGILFVHKTQSPHHFVYAGRKSSGHYFVISFIKPRKTPSSIAAKTVQQTNKCGQFTKFNSHCVR